VNKNIGFNRNIRLAWLDAAMAVCNGPDDPAVVRAKLEPIVGAEIASAENRRKAIDILVNIWCKSGDCAPQLRAGALALSPAHAAATGRLWLHYGLTLLAYPFFRDTAVAVGQLARLYGVATPSMVKQRLVSERGQIGSLDKAVERVLFSLRDWGLLVAAPPRNSFQPPAERIASGDPTLEVWLLACALTAHPAGELPASELTRLPELFPFRFGVTVDDLRRSPVLAVQRQGVRLDMVRLAAEQLDKRPQ